MTAEVQELVSAARDLLRFGEHAGHCEFLGTCSHCRQKLGRCAAHEDAMSARTARLIAAVAAVERTA